MGALALSAMALAAIAPPAFAVETGQLLDKGPRWPHKGSVKIGSAECPGPSCSPEVINQAEQRGQITPKEAKALRKIQSNPPSAEKGIKDQGVKSCNGCGMTGREAAPPPVDDGAAPAPSVDIETGQILIRDRPGRPVTERRAHNGPGGTPPSVTENGKTGWIIPTVSALAVGLGVLAVTSGDEKPASPS